MILERSLCDLTSNRMRLRGRDFNNFSTVISVQLPGTVYTVYYYCVMWRQQLLINANENFCRCDPSFSYNLHFNNVLDY